MSRLLPLTMLALAALVPAQSAAEVKILLGWVETVMLDPRLGLQLDAKLDTGADTSSLDAHNIRRVRVGEKRYVRFSVRHPQSGEWVELRKPYLRRARIKRHDGDYQRRYVVRMQVCVGDRTRSIEVNLIDRGEFEYPMLLGRSALAGWSVVDPDLEHETRPSCWRQPGAEPDDDAVNPPADDDLVPADDTTAGQTPPAGAGPQRSPLTQ